MANDIDVSLRLRLINQVSKPAEEAERDLKDLKNAADRIGRSTPGNLGRELDKLGISATEAKGKIGAIGSEAEEARRRIGRIDDGAFAGLKADAISAKAAINEVGQAATAAEQKIRQMRGYSAMSVPGGRLIADGRWQTQTHAPRNAAISSAAEGVLDQFGVPVAIGAGSAYLAGAVPAAALVAGGAAINAAAGDEQRSDALRVTGEYSEEEQRRIDALLARAGARRGVGAASAQGVFSALQAGGLSSGDASAMADNAIVFSKATQADATDAAKLTIALRNNMGIGADGMMASYDAIAYGGKKGQFEVPDMARYFPELAALMSGIGERGSSGVNLLTSLMQAARKNTGTSEAAATNVKGMLGKFLSEDFAGKAEEYGLDPENIIKSAQARGEQPVLAMLDAIRGKVGTDAFKLKQLMPDQESGAGLVSAVAGLNEIRAMMQDMKNAAGTVSKDYETGTDNFNSQRDRLSSNVGQNIKDLAAPILPMLTAIARAAAEQMERTRENQSKNPLSNMPGHDVTEGLMKFWLSNSASGPGQPSGWQRFLFGAGADENFNLRDHLGVDLRPTAENSMQGYNDALATEGEKATSEAQSIADRIKALLGFTVSPTITPNYAPPAGAPAASGQQSSIQPMSNRTTQYITSPNPQHAALRATRLQARQIQQAQARSLYDTGRRLT